LEFVRIVRKKWNRIDCMTFREIVFPEQYAVMFNPVYNHIWVNKITLGKNRDSGGNDDCRKNGNSTE